MTAYTLHITDTPSGAVDIHISCTKEDKLQGYSPASFIAGKVVDFLNGLKPPQVYDGEVISSSIEDEENNGKTSNDSQGNSDLPEPEQTRH